MIRRNRERWLTSLGAVLLAVPSLRALETEAWQFRQTLRVEQPGLIKLALPPATLGAARPNLEDLRLLDPRGSEVPYTLTPPAPTAPPTTRAPAGFQASLAGEFTQLLIETGLAGPLVGVTLATPSPSFLKGAQVELSQDGERWEKLPTGTTLFRQFGAEQLRLELPGRPAARLRVTIDDRRTRAIPFTGALLHAGGREAPTEETRPLEVRVLRRDEYAGETVLTVDLGGANVTLARLAVATSEPLLARPVTLAVREFREEAAVERTLAAGTIWRVAGEGVPSTSSLEIPVGVTVPTREMLVRVTNGDSPPLALEQITARQSPRWLVFHAAVAGDYALLTGNAQAASPRYDVAALAAALRATPPSALVPGPVTRQPGYRATAPLGGLFPRGSALDPAPWSGRRTVQLATAGVQQLDLDLGILTQSQPGLADLRLLRGGLQVPYLLERPPLARAVAIEFHAESVPRRPQVSRWRCLLPRAGSPILRLTLVSPTPLFQRDLRLYERLTDARRGEVTERTLATATWSHRPDQAASLTLSLSARPQGSVLLLETDNGDNPPIELASVQAAYPVARMLFAVEADANGGTPELTLCFGNPKAAAPRYDLALIAPQILAAEKSVARLASEGPPAPISWTQRLWASGGAARWIFWVSLAAVVGGLLLVVAKLLPKPPSNR